MKRFIEDQIIKDLDKKMVLLSGPRQVGKTSLAKSLMRSNDHYFNWDFS